MTADVEGLSAEELTAYYKLAQAEFEKLALLHNQRIIQSFPLDTQELDAMSAVFGALSKELRTEYVKDILTVYRTKVDDQQKQLNLVVKLSRLGIHQL